jgi:hypothetical protein
LYQCPYLLIVATTIFKETEKASEDAILSCKIAEIVAKNAINTVKGSSDFLKSFVLIAKDFHFGKNLVSYIFDWYVTIENHGPKFYYIINMTIKISSKHNKK